MGYIKNIIKGIAVGISMMVPGVSGGTMAIVLGIYDRLVHSVAAFFSDWKKNLVFLLQVGVGGAAGVLIFSRLMEGAMTSYPHIMRFLIMGIIIGGLPLLYRKASEEGKSKSQQNDISRQNDMLKGRSKSQQNDTSQQNDMLKGKSKSQQNDTSQQNNMLKRKSKSQQNNTSQQNDMLKGRNLPIRSGTKASDYGFLVLGIVIVLLMSLEPESLIGMATDGSLISYIFLLISGFIIAIGLVLPGISWSFMLLVLGMYEITLNAINTLNIPFLIPLGIGIASGTFGTAKLIERFLQRHPRKTYMLIIGFVVGSLAEVYPGIPQGWQLPVSLAAFAAGFALIFTLGKKGLTD